MSLSLCTALLAAQLAAEPGDALRISMTTFGPGDDIPSWWGHTALVVEDTRTGNAVLYNYGMFSFDETFLVKFVRGRLEFWVGEDRPGPTYRAYRAWNRDVRIQVLNLTPAERRAVAQALADNVRPENRDYLYHHYRDNCSTRPRDIVMQALAGALDAQFARPARQTFRAHTRRYTRRSALVSFFLDYMQNDELDQPLARKDEGFLPEELEAAFDEAWVEREGRREPLVAARQVYFKAQREPAPKESPNPVPPTLLLSLGWSGLILAGTALGPKRRWARRLGAAALTSWSAGAGLLGTVLALAWAVSDQTVTHRNENLLQLAPWHALLLPAVVAQARGRALRRGRQAAALLLAPSLLGLALKVLPVFDQNNWNVLALSLPLNVAAAVALWRAAAPAADATRRS